MLSWLRPYEVPQLRVCLLLGKSMSIGEYPGIQRKLFREGSRRRFKVQLSMEF